MIANLQSSVANFPLLIANFLSCVANFQSLIANFPTAAAYFPLFIANFPSCVANFPSLTANFPLTAANFPLTAANFHLPFADFHSHIFNRNRGFRPKLKKKACRKVKSSLQASMCLKKLQLISTYFFERKAGYLFILSTRRTKSSFKVCFCVNGLVCYTRCLFVQKLIPDRSGLKQV